jgi:hypothetical protein
MFTYCFGISSILSSILVSSGFIEVQSVFRYSLQTQNPLLPWCSCSEKEMNERCLFRAEAGRSETLYPLVKTHAHSKTILGVLSSSQSRPHINIVHICTIMYMYVQ